MRGRKKTPLSARFKRHYAVDANGCWIWTSTVNGAGYGTIGLGSIEEGKDFAHRVSWRLHHGEIPEGLLVCHKCDVKKCVNPDHLFLGTYQDNVDDMYAKGRGLTGKKRTPDKVTKGEQHGMAKLTEQQVIEIRSMLAAGNSYHREIASQFGVGRGTIGLIKNRRIWRHI